MLSGSGTRVRRLEAFHASLLNGCFASIDHSRCHLPPRWGGAGCLPGRSSDGKFRVHVSPAAVWQNPPALARPGVSLHGSGVRVRAHAFA